MALRVTCRLVHFIQTWLDHPCECCCCCCYRCYCGCFSRCCCSQDPLSVSIAAATTDDLSEGSTNQYFTEARVQTKLDHAFEQLRAMLNNLATTTTLVLNLSGDPTPGDVVTLGSIVTGGTGYSTSTGVATTSSGSGTGLTVDITASAGVIQSIAVNSDGSGYVAGETITISTGDGNAQVTVGTVKTMAVGNTITGGTSGTTGVITALGATSVTIDTIDGFFKKGETVSAGNVTTLTISTFA